MAWGEDDGGWCEFWMVCVDCGREYLTRSFTPGGPRVCLECAPPQRPVRRCMRCREPFDGPLCQPCEFAVVARREEVIQRGRLKRAV